MATKTKSTSAKKSATSKTAAKKTTKKAAQPKAVAKSNEAAAQSPLPPTKPAAPLSPKTAGAPAAMAATPTLVTAPETVIIGRKMRKKEIVEAVVARSGLKPRDVKPVLDDLLAVMRDAIGEGREMVLQPFGRVKVYRQKTTSKKNIFFAKVHQNIAPGEGGKDADED